MIEKSVQLPENANSRSRYPFGQMQVGDSLFFEGMNSQSRPSLAAKAYGKYHGWKFVSRSVDGGVRIWRSE